MAVEGYTLNRRELFAVAAGAGLLTRRFTAANPETFPSSNERFRYIADDLPAQNETSPLAPDKFHRSTKVQKAVDFMLSHQLPNGAFLTDFEKRELVPMDTAHASLGLVKAGYLSQAKEGMNWCLGKLTPEDGKEPPVSYAGSWWNEYDENGEPKRHSARGRAEQNGLALIAIDAICQSDPDYFTTQAMPAGRQVGGKTVAQHAWNMVEYLDRVQQPNGSFIHRPTFQKAFPEENVRMAEGLGLMAKRFMSIGEVEKAEKASTMSQAGFAALDQKTGFTYGMSYDYLARAMWKVSGRSIALEEVRNAMRAGKMTPDGVKMYDMKQDRLSYLDRDRWREKWPGLAYGTAETIEGAIALLSAGYVTEAQHYEEKIADLQKENGGFPTGFLSLISGGRETIYTAARFILLERLMTDVIVAKYQA